MKKYIILFLSILVIYSCGVTKKATKVETHLTAKTEIEKNDSAQSHSTREDLLNSIIEKIDKSTTKVTVYNPPDSTGKQSVNRTIETTNDIKTTTNTVDKTKQNTVIKTGSKQVAKKQTNLDQQQTTSEKKNKTPLKVYIYAILISGILVFFVYRWIRKKFL